MGMPAILYLSWICNPQAVYLDMDTLWMDYPDRLEIEFERMSEKHALFAMALETTDKNAEGSWYKGGDWQEFPTYSAALLCAGAKNEHLKMIVITVFDNACSNLKIVKLQDLARTCHFMANMA